MNLDRLTKYHMVSKARCRKEEDGYHPEGKKESRADVEVNR